VDTRDEFLMGVGNKGRFKEKANEPKSAGAPPCAGAWKSSMIVGLR
jgi:hypothetical protein